MLVALLSALASAQDRAPFPIHEKGALDELEKAPAPRKLVVFRGYGKYDANFKKICDLIRQDGRSDKLYEILYPASERDPECIACRPLIRPWMMACRPRVSVRKKPNEAVKTPPPKQLEPHVQVLEAVSLVFNALPQEKDILPETIKAVRKLVACLRETSSRTAGEQEYFSILAEYVEAPFKVLLASAPAGESPALQVTAAPTVKLDELF